MAFKTIDQLITDIEQTQNQINYWMLHMKNGADLLFSHDGDLSLKEQADTLEKQLDEQKWIRIGDSTRVKTEEVQAYENADLEQQGKESRHVYHELRKKIEEHLGENKGLIKRDELVENMDEKVMLKKMVEDGEVKIVDEDYTRYVEVTGK